MANGAGRIFNVIKNTSEPQVNNSLISVMVKTLNPLTFQIDDKISIDSNFYVLDKDIDSSKLKVGDVLNAFTFSNGQMYYINQCINPTNDIYKDKKINITTGTEYATNEYIDDKQVYGKRINVGALPNATGKSVAHGLTNFTLVRATGIAKNNSNTNLILPYSNTTLTYNVSLSVNATNIQIVTGSDRSGYTDVYVDLYYTKN